MMASINWLLINSQTLSRCQQTYQAFPLYDIEPVYLRESLQQRGLSAEDLVIPVTLLDAEQMQQLFNGINMCCGFRDKVKTVSTRHYVSERLVF